MKKRKINGQKIFCFISFIFLGTCVLWYGGRTIYFHHQSEKENESTEKTLVDAINKKELKKVDKNYYFYGKESKNYITYSNLTWRIIKITESDEIVLIKDTPIVHLAYGENKEYKESYINLWLNNTEEENTGILEKNLPEINLVNTKACLDKIDNIEKTACNETLNDYKIALPSLTDYINTGATNSFINNNYYTYLSNINKDNEIWYITDKGKLNTTDGTDILGIKPIITLPANTILNKGTGSEKDPYTLTEKDQYFGSYVKLDKDIWRVYNIDNDSIKLVLNDYLQENNQVFTHNYSQNNYYHNDTQPNTIANYLNKTYYDTLNYKDKINTDYYSNYYYNYITDYDYTEILKNKVDTKISLPSITDPIINNTLEDYFTNTGTGKTEKAIYTIKKNGTVEEINVSKEAKIIPCISIKKELLKKGTGSKNDPYEME